MLSVGFVSRAAKAKAFLMWGAGVIGVFMEELASKIRVLKVRTGEQACSGSTPHRKGNVS